MPIPSNIPLLSDRCVSQMWPRNCTGPDNLLTQCIKNEARLWETIVTNPAFGLLKIPSRYRRLNSVPFDVMPTDAVRLNQTGSILISTLVADQYAPVTSFLVPPGFDGVINNTLNKFVPQNGPSYQDGSGMLTWSLGINNYLAYGYTSITTQMGDNPQLGPTAHGGGIRIKPNDLITFYVVATAAGLAFLDPAGILLCAFQGWIYPNR